MQNMYIKVWLKIAFCGHTYLLRKHGIKYLRDLFFFIIIQWILFVFKVESEYHQFLLYINFSMASTLGNEIQPNNYRFCIIMKYCIVHIVSFLSLNNWKKILHCGFFKVSCLLECQLNHETREVYLMFIWRLYITECIQ